MKKGRLSQYLPFLLTLLFFCGCAVTSPYVKGQGVEKTSLDVVLDELFLEKDDLQVSFGPETANSFCLKRTERYLRSPISVFKFQKDIHQTFEKKKKSISRMVFLAGEMLDKRPDQPDIKKTLISLPEFENSRVLEEVYSAAAHANLLFMEAFKELDDNETAFIKETLEQLLFYGRKKDGLSRKESQDLIEQAFALSGSVNVKRIGEACYSVASALDFAAENLSKEDLTNISGKTIRTPLGSIKVGTEGDDVYEGEMPLILIDAGGDDIYRYDKCFGLNIIIDIAGDDIYQSAGNAFPGSGVLGLGFLLDMAGDDLYLGEKFSFGCGLMGAGILADLKGDDRYLADLFCQGAASFGIGILYDAAGDDVYRGNLYAQGMGYVNGVGILADIEGDDTFISGYSVPDIREKKGAFQTYSQGFGLGVRNFAAGGAGILYNGKGNDSYKGSYFCQGSAYWQALGILYDTAGDDTYEARRYSQGAGVHLSVGVLLDKNGDDLYQSWGVSQGCGHDYAVGILRDFKGNDIYEAEWLSQGAGNSRGIGMLLDDSGDDSYDAKNKNVQGMGVYDNRRDAESLGILIDNRGDDLFSSGIIEGMPWKRGAVGGCMDNKNKHLSLVFDVPEIVLTERKLVIRSEKKHLKTSFSQVVPELEEMLFLERSWKETVDLLYAKGPDVIPLLLNYLEIKDASVYWTIEETFKKFGEKQIDDIHAAVYQSETGKKEKAFLLYVLGDLKNLKTEDLFLDSLGHEDPKVQAMALRGLSKLDACPPIDLCRHFSKSSNCDIKRYLGLCLKNSEDKDALYLLCLLLKDDNFNVRYAAAGSLKAKGHPAVPFLKELMKKKGMLKSVYRMAAEIITAANGGKTANSY